MSNSAGITWDQDYEVMLSSRARNPEQKLMLAVIHRAICDLYSGGTEKRTAKEFLLSDRTDEMSFMWMCDHLGLNADDFVKRYRLLDAVGGDELIRDEMAKAYTTPLVQSEAFSPSDKRGRRYMPSLIRRSRSIAAPLKLAS